MPHGRLVCRFLSTVGWVVLLAAAAFEGGGAGTDSGSLAALVPVVPVVPVAPVVPVVPVVPASLADPAPSAAATKATSRVVAGSITSARTGATYPLEIYLPASYDGGSVAAYPVIYAMDGDAVFNAPGTRFENFERILEQRHAQAILVGIGGTARREQDYLLPGARAYHDFLTQELVPFIEARYRADAHKRMLTGLSWSGSMTGLALFMEAASGTLTFSHFLAFEASFDSQEAENNALEQRMFDAWGRNKPLPATLVLTRCDSPRDCNFGNVNDMYKRLRSRGYPQFVMTETTYIQTHPGTDVASFADVAARLFP
jgi:enterochelin esterase-like enzyme